MTRNRRGPLNPEGTRNAIVQAALTLLAENGPEGVSFSEVARLAGVDRGTAHRHFQTRDQLLKATAKMVSDKLFKAVFGDSVAVSEVQFQGSADIMEKNDRLIRFGMENPELCRIWLFEVMSSKDPASDPFWKAFLGSYAAFAETDAAEENLNSEVLAIIMLASSFLWPIWMRSHAKSEKERRALAESFSDECLRLSMFGSLKSERFPEIARHLKGEKAAPAKTRAKSLAGR